MERELLRAAPTLVRLAAEAWWRTASWTLATTARSGSRVARAATSGEAPGAVFEEAGSELRQYLRDLLGLVDVGGGDTSTGSARPDGRLADDVEAIPLALRERGADLLRRSADVELEEDLHPAYARILDDLAPDEARILRLLALEGPQPAVDVRAGALPLNINSELVAPGLTMIGAEAGCRHTDRVQAYLNNVYRLGLIWFSREALEDLQRYHVLEAQPEVAEAMDRAGRGRTVRRSIHLTPFGEDFCEMCLPLETEEMEVVREDVPSEQDMPSAYDDPPPGT
jgi:hypothetical protein